MEAKLISLNLVVKSLEYGIGSPCRINGTHIAHAGLLDFWRRATPNCCTYREQQH